MELRYIEYAGGNFRSCQDDGPQSATDRNGGAAAPPSDAIPPRSALFDYVSLADLPGVFEARAAKAVKARPAAVPSAASAPEPEAKPCPALASLALPQPELPAEASAKAPDIAPARMETPVAAPAPPPRIAEPPLANAPRPDEAQRQKTEIRRQQKDARRLEKRARRGALRAERSTAKAAKEAQRRTLRAAREARRQEREIERTRQRAGLAAAARPPSRTRMFATHAAAALGIVAAAGVSIWYFTTEHGRFEREARLAAASAAIPTPAPLAAKPVAPAATRPVAPRATPAALLAIAGIENAVERRSFQNVVRVQRGDNFFTLLMRTGVPGAEAQLANIALAGVYDVRKMRAGQLITIDFGIVGEEHNRFLGVRFDSNYDRTVWIQRQARGEFVSTEIKKELTLQVMRNNGMIDHSVFQAGLHSGLPPEPVVRMINLFAYDIDFQRDVQKGDTFETLIEQHRDRDGNVVRYGNILYASLTVQGQVIKLYRWQGEDGEADYFSEKGESSRKALMRTPIDGARLSSGFGYRRHPILGYSKMHQGVDFAAPSGTPIYAAGTGQIERIGWAGGYGNSITIRHTKEYATLYGHMSGFAPGMAVGKRVKQGDVIGFVGTTGMSTGPHLHYEVHLSGKQIDPLSLKLPSRQRLQGPELARYLEMVRTIDARWRTLARNGATGNGIVLAGEQEADTGCVNGIRLDPVDKRACE